MHSDIISVFTWNVSHYIVSWKRLYEPSTSRCSLRRIRPFASPAACESLSVRTGRVHAWICSSLSASFPCCLWRRCWQCWREPRRTVYAAKAVRHLTFCAGAVLGGGDREAWASQMPKCWLTRPKFFILGLTIIPMLYRISVVACLVQW